MKGVYERIPGSGIWWIRYAGENGKERRERRQQVERRSALSEAQDDRAHRAQASRESAQGQGDFREDCEGCHLRLPSNHFAIFRDFDTGPLVKVLFDACELCEGVASPRMYGRAA